MSDNIQVAIRVRPLNQRELHDSQGKKCIQASEGTNSVSISINSSTKTFNYDSVSDEDIGQDEIFERIGRPIATSCIRGYNGSIFAYGQTGSGKTYTIMGGFNETTLTFQNRGILPRCVELIFSSIKRETKKNPGLQYLVKCWFIEIYNEQVNDLLCPELRNLQIREDIKKGAYIENHQQETVTSFEDTYEILEKGVKNRHIGSTSMNKESSRSHSVFTLQIESKEKREDVLNFKNSYFHLIDLAGSERQKFTETYGERLKEAGMINKSLSSLGNVINSLVEISEGKSRHVPYRDSKLTFLLKDSLGGNSKTCIIANISPSLMSYGETLSTLRFAERAKLVTNKAIINEDTMGTVSELREEVKRLKALLKNHQDSPAVAFSLDLSERIKSVEGLLEQNLRIRLQSETALQQEIADRDDYISNLSSALEKCEKKINGDKKVIKNREETIKKLQKSENVEESRAIKELKEEIEMLRRENENHPAAARFAAENDQLKRQIAGLENEMKESELSLTARLKENQDFTEKLQIALRKSTNEREQLHILLEEYSKKAKSDGNQDLSTAKKQIAELKSLLEEERNRVLNLESQLNSLTDSQNLDDSRSSRFSTINTSGIISSSDFDRQQDLIKKFLNENEKLARDLDGKTQKIKELERQITLSNKEIVYLRKVEEGNFRYESEIDKLKDEIMRKDNKIEELQNEVETIIAENEFLSTQFIEFGQQISQKERKIFELNEKLSMRPNKNQIEEIIKSKNDLEDAKKSQKSLETEVKALKEELEISVKSRESMIEELKRLQNERDSLQNDCGELKSKLISVENRSDKLRESVEGLNNEISQVSGSNNLNQKIKLHVKMKEENNKLKDQNYQLKEDLRKKNEKIEIFMKKIELLSTGNASKDIIESEIADKERLNALEDQVKENLAIVEEVNAFVYSLPFIDDIKGFKLIEKVQGVVEGFSQDLSEKQEKIEELNKEIGKRDSSLKILENENLLLRQKLSKLAKA